MPTKATVLACFLSISAFSIQLSSTQENETKPPSKKSFSKFFKANQFHQKLFSYSDAETNEDDLENPFAPPPIPQNSAEADPWSTFMNPPNFPGASGPGSQDKIKTPKDPWSTFMNPPNFPGPSGPGPKDPWSTFMNPPSFPGASGPSPQDRKKIPKEKEQEDEKEKEIEDEKEKEDDKDKEQEEEKSKEEDDDAETEATRSQRFIGGPTAFDPFFFSNPLSPPSHHPVIPPPSPPRRHHGGGGFGYNGYYPYELFMVVQPRMCSNASETNSTEDVATKFLTGAANGGPTPPNPEPPRCVFAIAACCAPFNYHVRYPCFEMLGCYGAFWDANPCSEGVVSTAVNDLKKFYDNEAPEAGQDNSTTTTTTTTVAPTTAAPAAPARK